MKTLQRIGKSLVTPLSFIPIAGLFLAISTTIMVLVSEGSMIWEISNFLNGIAKIPFENLPILFAVSVTIGLTDDSGSSALIGMVGYLLFLKAVGLMIPIAENIYGEVPNFLHTSVFGISTLQTGVFGGIIVGLLVAYFYNKYYDVQFPEAISFFSGIRFIAIIVFFAVIPLALIVVSAWPGVVKGLMWFGSLSSKLPLALDSFIFGAVERGLIPFGLHHLFYPSFWYTELGGSALISGTLVSGDFNIWTTIIASPSINSFKVVDINGITINITRFMAGKYPFMIFGLPAAALAIYKNALPKERQSLRKLITSAIVLTALTGVTEPIEFALLLATPILYVIHSIFAGVSFMLMNILGGHIGTTFSGGIIDLIIYGIIPWFGGKETGWYVVIIVGLILMPLYYITFDFVIRKFDLKTPGRNVETKEKIQKKENKEKDIEFIANKVLEYLGGKDNIESLDACFTRLRISVYDEVKVEKDKFKELGAAGFLLEGQAIQIVFGPKADQIKRKIQKIS